MRPSVPAKHKRTKDRSDFPEGMYRFGKELVPAHRHRNGWGWVADSATVDGTAFVGPTARVSGEARVLGKARVQGYSHVGRKATIEDGAVVTGHARVLGTATLRPKSKVMGNAFVAGDHVVETGTVLDGNSYEVGSGADPEDGSTDARSRSSEKRPGPNRKKRDPVPELAPALNAARVSGLFVQLAKEFGG